ncbi:EEF1A lysine methyltransferase 3-like [Cetorhinus maximus]
MLSAPDHQRSAGTGGCCQHQTTSAVLGQEEQKAQTTSAVLGQGEQKAQTTSAVLGQEEQKAQTTSAVLGQEEQKAQTTSALPMKWNGVNMMQTLSSFKLKWLVSFCFGLCQYFQQERMDFSGKKVIELGSGTGIMGILAVLLGGQVTLTDGSHALKQIEHNVSVNVPDPCRHFPTIRTLSWGFDHMNFPNDYDIILGSDIVYYPSDYPSLLQTLRHLSNQRTTIYIATQIRGCHATRRFHEELIPQYFNSHIIQGDWCANVNLYKVTLKSPKTGEELPMERGTERNLLSN